MRTASRWLLTALLAGAALAAVGSAPGRTAPEPQKGEQTRVALTVVPFVNASEDAQADQKVLGAWVTELLGTGFFTVTEPAVVETALTELRVRGQLDAEQMRQVAERSGARLLLMGTITEYGTSRGGGSSRITVAIDARLVDAPAAQIIWAGAVVRSGQESDRSSLLGSLFGRRRPPSLSRLTQEAVGELVSRITRERERIVQAAAAPLPDRGAAAARDPVTATPPPVAGPPAGPPRAGLLASDSELTLADLGTLLPALPDTERGDVRTEERLCGPRATARYRAGAGLVDVTLVDYGTPERVEEIVRARDPAAEAGTFSGLLAFSQEGGNGAAQLNVAAGRFGLYLRARAPAEQEALARRVATEILATLGLQVTG